jgi:predicted nuclease of predicted toxin-antitoxin system
MEEISFYLDEMVSRAIAEQLLRRGYNAVMAVDIGMKQKDDLEEHLPLATAQGRVVVTFDRPFAGRASKQTDHAGLICLTCAQDDIGGAVRALTEFVETHSPEEAAGRVFWL